MDVSFRAGLDLYVLRDFRRFLCEPPFLRAPFDVPSSPVPCNNGMLGMRLVGDLDGVPRSG